MKEQLKISVRFFDDREIRAVWDDDCSKWWFSVLDIVGALNEEPDYTKVRNYWKYLKTKLKKENNQLVSATNQLKLLAEYSGQTEPLNPGQTEPVIPGQTEPVIPVKLSHLRV